MSIDPVNRPEVSTDRRVNRPNASIVRVNRPDVSIVRVNRPDVSIERVDRPNVSIERVDRPDVSLDPRTNTGPSDALERRHTNTAKI